MTIPKDDTARRSPADRAAIADVTDRGILRPAVRYAMALGLMVVAFTATVLFAPLLRQAAFLFFWPAIIGVAWLAGFRSALISSVAAVLLVDYFVIEPAGLQLNQPSEIGTLVAFVALAALTGWAVSAINRANANAGLAARDNARLARELENQSIELTHQLEESQGMQEELEQSSEELAERTGEAEAAERFTRSILESISDPFVVYDPEWRMRYMNAAARGVLPQAAPTTNDKELIGRVVWEVWPEARGTIVEAEMRRAADSRVPVHFEAFNPRTAAWSEMYCYPLPDGGLATQWKNITARRRAEEAAGYLTRATELLSASLDYEESLAEVSRLIVPQFADWCAIQIVQDDGTLRQVAVAHVDPERIKWAEEINLRYPPDLNATSGVPQVVRTGEAELYSDIPDELLVAGAVDEEHLRLTREIGLKSAMIVPLETSQRTLGAVTVVSAESGRRYTSEDLDFLGELARRAALAVENAWLHHTEQEARKSAEAANEAKTQFLAVMSHELRTPLNAIGGYTELLMMGIRGAITPDQQADLERIQRSQRNLLSLINDILNYAKLDAGHVEFRMEPVGIHALLLDLEPLITPQLRAREIVYDYAACSSETMAYADTEKLRQVLLNLLSNAIKFTEPEGTISVACSEVDEVVCISVIDTGIGIPPERLASVFEPFVQLERRLTSNHEGTGLGLAISRDLARGMGGDLTAESRVGEGSEFRLTLKKQ
ncbi:MAG: ATP-binding protein [Gemmatimonadaceae bacterium]